MNSITVQIGQKTNIGNCDTNQDESFVIPIAKYNGCAIGVIDGYGKKGEMVAKVCKDSVEYLIKAKVSDLIENPVCFLENVYEYTHEQVINQFGNQKCGATFTIIILLESKIYIANVGDSSGVIYSREPLNWNSHLKFEKDVAIPLKKNMSLNTVASLNTYIELTSNHSPDNVEEYIRMRNYKSCEKDTNYAKLACLYDKRLEDKHECPPIFEISENGVPFIRPKDGSFECYYKNICRKLATYVCDEKKENVLGVTRSIGNLCLNQLGVSHKPEIRSMDLKRVFEDLHSADSSTLCIALCTGGVWNNWLLENLEKFVMDTDCLNNIAINPKNGAQHVVTSLMLKNQVSGEENFGKDSDNATCIIMYVSKEKE